MRKFLIAILALVALVVIGYFGYQVIKNRQQTKSISNLETVTANQGSLTATVGATGSVRPDQTALIPWQTTGNVDQVYVQVGDVVTTGQVLASLEKTSLPQNVIMAQSELITAQKQLDDLQNNQSASKQALQAVDASQQAVYDAERAMVRFDQKAYKDELEKAKDTVVDKKDALDQAQKDFDPYKDWDPTNATYQKYEQRLADAQIAYDESVRKVNELELQQQAAQANLDAANAALADAQRAYDQVKDGPNPDDITVLNTRIAAAQATLDNARLAAPFKGTISEVDVKSGDQVSPGLTALRLDDLGRLLIDVQVSEVDINSIKVGQLVTLSFDAIQDRQYNGVVSKVAPVGNVIQGVVNFDVTVELNDADENVKPGMTAAVNIIVDQITDALLVPNRAVRVVDGKQVVYILDNGQLKEVEITLGASSGNMSEVTSGNLQAGDQVVLNPPQDLMNMGGPFGG